MYRTCTFCAAGLGSNQALECFPVGGTVAFDAWKGRLWAVCPRCARWNLAPIEERWEATEEADRLFTDARLRVQSENIGLARLRDGTRLVRIGRALPGELAAWRYGSQLAGRRRRYLVGAGLAATAGAAVVAGGLYAGVSFGLFWALYSGFGQTLATGVARQRRVTVVGPSESPSGEPFTLRRWHLGGAHLALPESGGDGGEPELHLPYARRRLPPDHPAAPADPRETLVLSGPAARAVLGRLMVGLNRKGASPGALRPALRILEEAGSAGEYVRAVAARRRPLGSGSVPGLTPDAALALEMALHEESERRALEGELSALQAAWREAEEIAAIADALPDDPLARLGARASGQT